MNKYVIKFRKEGYIKYISHLDLVRVFHRAFKMAELKLRYSEGFNPHPKMSFVQPLSLGYSSRAELLEFELIYDMPTDGIISTLNPLLPCGIEILDCKEYEDKKTLSSNVISCEYKIYIPIKIDNDLFENYLKKYLSQNEINIEKESKKKKEVKLINIKPMIRSIESSRLGEFIILDALLDSGSISNLSPELLIASLLDYTKLNVKRHDIEVERIQINFTNNFQI